MKSTFRYLAFGLLVAVAFAACKNKPRDTPRNGMGPDSVLVEPAAAACQLIPRGVPTHKDPLASLNGSIENDCLHLTYSYSGGCKEHVITFHWSGAWAESMPPQTVITVGHDAQGDGCEAVKSGEAFLDLKDLRYGGVKEVNLGVRAPGVEPLSFRYVYGDR